MQEIETIIIGAGPIGLETAVELSKRKLPYIQIEGGAVGQQILDFPPQTRWFSSPDRLGISGVPFVTPTQEKGTREEYLAYLRAVVEQFKLKVRTFERVSEAKRCEQGGFQLRTETLAGAERTYTCRQLILATGGTARPRKLGIPGEDLPHVSDWIGEPHRFLGRRVLVVGGKNSACDGALRAFRCGAQVTISYRGDDLHERVKYWIRPELKAMIESAQIDAYFNTVPERIERDSVQLRHLLDDGVIEVPVDDVLVAIGFEADSSLFESLGAELSGTEQRVVHEKTTMETSVPGLYVAGTAVAGTQARYRVYVENSHIHAHRIACALSDEPPPPEPVLPKLPES